HSAHCTLLPGLRRHVRGPNLTYPYCTDGVPQTSENALSLTFKARHHSILFQQESVFSEQWLSRQSQKQRTSNIELRTRPESESGRQYCASTILPLTIIVMAVCSSDLLCILCLLFNTPSIPWVKRVINLRKVP